MTTGKNGGSARLIGAIASRLGFVETGSFQEGDQQVRQFRGLGMTFRRKTAASSLTLQSPATTETAESLKSLASQLEPSVVEMKAPAEFKVETPIESELMIRATAQPRAAVNGTVASSPQLPDAEIAVEPWLALPEVTVENLAGASSAASISSLAASLSEDQQPGQVDRPVSGRYPILSGKTVGVIGFSGEEAAKLGSALAAQYCSFLILSHEEAEFKKGSTNGCDLLIMQARPEWGVPGALYPGSALKTKRPAAIVGEREALSAVALWTHGGAREFIPTPWVAGDAIWRAATLLTRTEANKTRRGKKTGRKLVIIGDSDTAASTLLHAVLSQEGIACHVAENGVSALALAKSKQADALIVDVSLPGLDGFQVLAELKRDPAMSQIVTILLTARQAEADVLRGFGLGADDYITKPFSPMEVVARLKRFLLRKP